MLEFFCSHSTGFVSLLILATSKIYITYLATMFQPDPQCPWVPSMFAYASLVWMFFLHSVKLQFLHLTWVAFLWEIMSIAEGLWLTWELWGESVQATCLYHRLHCDVLTLPRSGHLPAARMCSFYCPVRLTVPTVTFSF